MKTAWGTKKRLEKLRQEEWKYFDALGAYGYNAPSDVTI
jgi:hypothetical protein